MEHDPIVENFKKWMNKCVELFAKKHADYGPNNIAKFGEVGVMVRLNDKFERLLNLFLNGKNPNNEAIEDTLMDIANYAIIWLMIRAKEWPNAKSFKITKED